MFGSLKKLHFKRKARVRPCKLELHKRLILYHSLQSARISLQNDNLFIDLLISDKGIMAQPDIKQEPLSPGNRMMPSCSQEIDLEEVTSFKMFS